MKAQVKKISGYIKTKVSEINPRAKVILYGSRARGDFHKESDWDLLILTDEVVNQEQEDLLRNKLFELELEKDLSLSVFILSKNEWNSTAKTTPYYFNVTQEGIVL